MDDLIRAGDKAPDFELPDQDRVKRFHDKQALNFTLLADEL